MQPGGPQMLRDLTYILGLPELKYESERWKIDNGNVAMRFSCQVGHACLQRQVPFVFENPWTSLLWEAPQMKHLRRRRGVRMARADFCQYGMLWRKATGLLCAFVNTALIERRCTGCRGICSRTGRKHVQLSGTDPKTGQFLTHLAEPYPRGLCSAIVKALCEGRLMIQHGNLKSWLQF